MNNNRTSEVVRITELKAAKQAQTPSKKMSVKRSAPSSTIKEHPPKKRLVEKGQSAASAPRKKQLARAPANPRAKSRRKPVTAAEDYDDDDDEPNSSGVEDDHDDFPDLLNDDEFEDEGAADEEDAMDMDPGAPKDPNGALCEFVQESLSHVLFLIYAMYVLSI
jgi:hypothetical protein